MFAFFDGGSGGGGGGGGRTPPCSPPALTGSALITPQHRPDIPSNPAVAAATAATTADEVGGVGVTTANPAPCADDTANNEEERGADEGDKEDATAAADADQAPTSTSVLALHAPPPAPPAVWPCTGAAAHLPAPYLLLATTFDELTATTKRLRIGDALRRLFLEILTRWGGLRMAPGLVVVQSLRF